MKRNLLILKMVTLCLAALYMIPLWGLEKPQLARLHYDGGGDWYNNQDMIPNMVEVLNRELHTDFSPEEAVVKPSDSKLYDYPFVIMTGHGNIDFSEKDAETIREWLLRGGCLYADDDYGMDEAFRREIKKVFPEKDLVELPASHPVFSSYYDFGNKIPKIHEHDDSRPQAFAIFSEDGRLMVLYTYETNITDGWSNAHDDPANIRQQAFKMGVNILYYLFTRG